MKNLLVTLFALLSLALLAGCVSTAVVDPAATYPDGYEATRGVDDGVSGRDADADSDSDSGESDSTE